MSRTTSGSNSRPGSLTNVVQSLVRAQYGLTVRESSTGASTPGSSNGASASAGNGGETETDLDRHVAELLMKEAKEREERSKRENVGYWRLSDDEGEQQYQSKTNKRFLTNMIRNVEDHNKPLIRQQSRKEDLDTIRARERAEREKRTGVRDSERNHRRGDSTTGTRDETVEASTSTAPRRTGREGRAGPGFAARSLAIGLSGALDARKQEDKKRKEVQEAVEKAIETVQESRKGKERAREAYGSHDEDAEEEYHRASKASKASRFEATDSGRSRRDRSESVSDSRKRERTEWEEERGSRRRKSSSKERSHKRRERSRSRSDAENADKRRRDDRPSSSSRHHSSRRRRSFTNDERDESVKTSSSHSSKRPFPKDTKKRRRTRSPTGSTHSLSESEADSSDTFVDTTGLADRNSEGGTSKMDKYFSTSYNPALDVSFTDLTDPSTGLIGEGNFSEWDKMLHVLKKRKEDKSFGVTQAREEERERQLRKFEKKKRKEDREERRALKKEKSKKRRKRRDGSDSESDSSGGDNVGPKMRSDIGGREPKTVVIDGYEYGKKGSVRAWDLGKE